MDDIYSLSDIQIQKKIGEKLKAVRLKQNITQDSLAELSSISRSSVQKIESGEIRSFDVFLRILRTLGMLDELTRLCEEEQIKTAYEDVEERDLGLMLYDMDYSEGGEPQPMFFRAVLKRGVLDLRNCEVIR